MKIVIHKRVGDHGNLFGSVTANDIADALTKKGIEVDKRRIELGHPIKSVGVHDVEVRLHREVAAHIQVEVVPEGKESIEVPPVAAAVAAPPAEEAEA
jgi:large subunit ribosomal protein L9